MAGNLPLRLQRAIAETVRQHDSLCRRPYAEAVHLRHQRERLAGHLQQAELLFLVLCEQVCLAHERHLPQRRVQRCADSQSDGGRAASQMQENGRTPLPGAVGTRADSQYMAGARLRPGGDGDALHRLPQGRNAPPEHRPRCGFREKDDCRPRRCVVQRRQSPEAHEGKNRFRHPHCAAASSA